MPHIATNFKMIGKNWEINWEHCGKGLNGLIGTISLHFHGGTELDYKKPRSGQYNSGRNSSECEGGMLTAKS
jgi:hypothetical protein